MLPARVCHCSVSHTDTRSTWCHLPLHRWRRETYLWRRHSAIYFFFFIAILNSSIIWGITIIKMWFWTVMQNFTLRQNSNYSTSSKLKPKLTSEKCLLTCCEGISFLPGVPSHTTGLRSAWMANGNDGFVYLSFACPYTIKMGHQNSHIVEWCCFHVSSC